MWQHGKRRMLEDDREKWSFSTPQQQWHLSQSWTHLCFSGLSYCHGFGKKSLFTGNKLSVLPTALLGWGGGRSWLFLLLRKLQLLGVCECCNSLLPNPTSFPRRWHFPTPASATWVFAGFVVPERAEGSLEAAGPMLWLNLWGQTPAWFYHPLYP